MSLTQEQLDRLQASVAVVREKILAADPGAGGAEVGGLFDAYGSVIFTPVRDPLQDFSSWGDWEAWEHQKPDGPKLVPTGDWVAWHAPSGQQIGFPGPKARLKAEGVCVLWNEGKKTRVVPANGGFCVSAVDYDMVKTRVEAMEKAAAKE